MIQFDQQGMVGSLNSDSDARNNLHSTIQRLRADGVPAKDIAQQFGLTVGQVVYASGRPGTSRAAMQQRLDAVCALSEQGLPVQEIAEALGLPYCLVVIARRKLADQGRLQRWSVTQGKPWIPAEELTLKDMWADGRTPSQIARELPGRAPSAIRRHVKAKGYQRRHDLVLTCRAAALHLGVSYTALAGWLNKGWIPYRLQKPSYVTGHAKRRKKQRDRARKAAGRTKQNRKAFAFQIEEQALYEFVADHRYWPAWSIAAIADDELRDYAHEVRDGQDRWLATAAVAERYHTTCETVSFWIRTKQFPATRIGPGFYIWEDDLVGFEPPAKGTVPRREPSRRSHECPSLLALPSDGEQSCPPLVYADES